jgi:NAD+ synthase
MTYKLTQFQIENTVFRAAKALKDYCVQNDVHYVITGSSGGLDSAVTLALAERAVKLAATDGFKLTSVGLIMPCHSKPDAEILGREAIQKFGAKEIRIDLSDVFDFAMPNLVAGVDVQIKKILEETGGTKPLSEWDWSQKIAQGNIRSRFRMVFGTYHVARMMTRAIVLSTDNLSEYWMAFLTINGDVGDFGMIQHMMKGLELYDIARYLRVPDGILAAKPDDGLGISGGDEDQLGAMYPVLDRTMVHLIQNGFNPDGHISELDALPACPHAPSETVAKLARRCVLGAHKRRGAIALSRAELGLPPLKEIKL